VIWVRGVRGAGARTDERTRVGMRWLLTCALVIGVVFGWSSSAFGSPVWKIDAMSNTTVAPGGQLNYIVQVTNVGGDPGFAPQLAVTLPAGMTFAPGFNASSFGLVGCTPADPSGLSSLSCFMVGPAFVDRHSLAQAELPVVVDSGVLLGEQLTSSFTVSGGGASDSATTVDTTNVSVSPPGFGIAALDGQVSSDSAGDPLTQAGGHPYAASVSIDFNTLENPNPLIGSLWPVEATKDVVVDLPGGLAGYPPTAAKCTAAQLVGARPGFQPAPLCPPSSQVGATLVRLNGLGATSVFGPIAVYNMVPPPDVPARFGFNIAGSVVTLDARVRADENYHVAIAAVNVPEALPIASTTTTLWGVPADSSHDNERGCAGQNEPFMTGASGPTCPSGAPQVAFLRNPTSCTDPSDPNADGLTTTAHIDSWAHPGPVNADGSPDLRDPRWVSASFVSHLPPAYPNPPSAWGPDQLPAGCDQVPFDPTLSASVSAPAKTSTPSGLTVDLNLPQSSDPTAIGEGDLKKAVVTFPVGMRVSPSSAAGLEGCSPDQIGLGSNSDPTCPDGARIGKLAITTPLLDQPLDGSVYLATPHQNPFNSLIAIYLVAKGPGFVLKLPGRVDLDPATGQISTTFDNQPQLPFSNLHLELDGGANAPLETPDQCGTYTTKAVMTSWSGKTVESDSTFSLSADGNGAPCPPAGFSPDLAAGEDNPIARAESPFVLRLTRGDQDQGLGSLALNMPGGATGRLAATVPCPDVAANAGTCQDVSKIGDVTVGAGPGTNPFFITNGRAYITGPYKGADLGLSIVVPAVAGPFDLGNVVVRSAVFVNRQSAALKIVSDPLPTILQGIPLDVRDIRVFVNRPHFFINPTDCAEKHIYSTVASTLGAIAHPSVRFQVGECASLPHGAKLAFGDGGPGHTHAGVSTPFTTTLTTTPGGANLRSVSVTLPGTLNALLPVVNQACSLAAYDAGHCGSRARVGSAVAVTPLLRDPLRGSVYFVKNPKRAIPDIMVALRGQVNLDVTGKVAIPGGTRLATRFDTIPDAPITKFTLRLVSGRNGPLGIVTDLCSAKARAAVATIGLRFQDGTVQQTTAHIKTHGCPRR
jgi:uncharacterized repeat protein (TIGR01451 family)